MSVAFSVTPDLRLPSQPQGITAPWPTPNYAAWWQRHTRVNNCPRLLAESGSRTRDLLCREPTPYGSNLLLFNRWQTSSCAWCRVYLHQSRVSSSPYPHHCWCHRRCQSTLHSLSHLNQPPPTCTASAGWQGSRYTLHAKSFVGTVLLLLLLMLLLLHPFNSHFSRTTCVSRYQKGKTSLYLNEARDDGVWGWQWHQLDHIQTICTLLQTDNYTKNLIAHHKRINLGGIKFSDEWATKLLEVVSGSLETGSVVMDGCTRSHNCSHGYTAYIYRRYINKFIYLSIYLSMLCARDNQLVCHEPGFSRYRDFPIPWSVTRKHTLRHCV